MCAPIQLAMFALSASQQMQAQRQADKAMKEQQKAISAIKQATAMPAPAPRARRDDLTGGYSSTLLTGPAGVAPGSQNIGSNTLLGQ